MTLAALAPPIAYTLFLWWFSTGVILWLDGLPRRTFPWSLGLASGVLVAALYGLQVSADNTTAMGAYCAFTCALLVWGWLEMSFLMGLITGPRRSACPPGSRGCQRTRYAIEAVLHHEVALLIGGLAVLALTWEGDNAVGMWTYTVLWVSRVSAKLNVFLGARNLSEEFLPAHLRYLQTYFRRRNMNPLFPVSLLIGTLVACVLWWQAAITTGDAGVGRVLVASLLTLAVVEHMFLMVPLPSAQLWYWAMHRRNTRGAAAALPQETR